MKKIAVISQPRSGSNYFTNAVCEYFGLANSWEIFHPDIYIGDTKDRLLQLTMPDNCQGVLFKVFPHHFQTQTPKKNIQIIKDQGFQCIWFDRENAIDQFLSFRYAVQIDTWTIANEEEKEKLQAKATRNILRPSKSQFGRFMVRKNMFYDLLDELGGDDLFLSYESFLSNKNKSLEEVAYKLELKKEQIETHTTNLKSDLDYELITENYQEVESWFKSQQINKELICE